MTARSTCPACQGRPTSPMFLCGGKYSQVLEQTCPYCGGAGSVVAGRAGWVAIGERLHRARLGKMVGIVWEGGRKCLTLRRDVPLQAMPLDLEAQRYRIPAAMLAAIEAGEMDPGVIAGQVDKVLPETLADVDRQLPLDLLGLGDARRIGKEW